MTRSQLRGRLVLEDRVASGRLTIEDDTIAAVDIEDDAPGAGAALPYFAPGFVDVHVHGWGGFDAMGDADQLDGMARVLLGKGREFAFLSVNAIRTYADKGMVLVGPLPEELQNYNEYIAVPSAMSTKKEVAWEFARFCGGPGKPLLVANGIT